MATTYVLVDLENVALKNVGPLNGSALKVKVFLGANQVKIPVQMARSLQAFGPDAEYIQIEGNGSNALDFHIAFYIGRLAAEAPDAHFYVISKDKGFDPLVRHVNQLGIACRRADAIADISKPIPSAATLRERVAAAIDNLAKRKAAKPRSLKTLRTSLKGLFANQLTDEAIDALIQELAKRQVITVEEDKIHYPPESGSEP